MLLRIQRDESLRSYVERNLYVHWKSPAVDFLRELPYCHYDNGTAAFIAELFGWKGCYGYNKLLHLHTSIPWHRVLKSKYDHSYSGSTFLPGYQCIFDNLKNTRSYCPLCVLEDINELGYSYWRRIPSRISVCATHNVKLLTKCDFCGKPFSRDGHAVNVMWSGCAGRCLGEVAPVLNTEPMALRLAKFFGILCALDFHVSGETVLRVIEEKLKDLIRNGATEKPLVEKLEQLRVYMDKRAGYEGYDARASEHDLDDLLESIALAYEGFDEFLEDYHRYEPNPEPIDYYWNSYRVPGHSVDQFIKEDYRLGVGIWSCPKPDDYMNSLYYRNRRQTIYSCCNQPHPRQKGHQLQPVYIGAPLPRIPHLGGRLGSYGHEQVPASPCSPTGHPANDDEGQLMK